MSVYWSMVGTTMLNNKIIMASLMDMVPSFLLVREVWLTKGTAWGALDPSETEKIGFCAIPRP